MDNQLKEHIARMNAAPRPTNRERYPPPSLRVIKKKIERRGMDYEEFLNSYVPLEKYLMGVRKL